MCAPEKSHSRPLCSRPVVAHAAVPERLPVLPTRVGGFVTRVRPGRGTAPLAISSTMAKLAKARPASANKWSFRTEKPTHPIYGIRRPSAASSAALFGPAVWSSVDPPCAPSCLLPLAPMARDVWVMWLTGMWSTNPAQEPRGRAAGGEAELTERGDQWSGAIPSLGGSREGHFKIPHV